jgi:DNA-binding SARP family transcriptional activator/tetratricopeptide (TPR) repeat protein
VEFRLLGPVQLRIDGRPVDIGPARQRTVLAVLLLGGPAPVPTDTFIRRVWGDRPPERARDVLYTYVTRLRRALRVAEGARVRRERGGYVIEVDPDAVDADRFIRLLAAARRGAGPPTAGAAAELAARVARYREALALWRGTPLEGLTGDWVEQTRGHLDRQRLTALVECFELELARGNHAAVVDELSDLVAADPTVEPLVSHLMLALYRGGRQAEALDAFRGARRALTERHGVEPGTALADRQRAILVKDPALDLPTGMEPAADTAAQTAPKPAPVAARPRTVPAQLPPDPAGFTGRAEPLAALDRAGAAARDGAGVVVAAVSGMAGIGKTTLAVHWAHRQRAAFPDGQLYVNLHGFDPHGAAVQPAEAVRGFLDALGVPGSRVPAGLPAQVGLYRSLLADRRMLVLLDNARDAEQVRPLLPGSGTALVLVTSRTLLDGLVAIDAARPVPLGELSFDEGRALLAHRLDDARVRAEPAAVDDIVTACAGLPLALAIAAARAATNPTRPLADLARQLRAARTDLDAFAGQDAAADVRSVFSLSYGQLAPAARRLFRLLGLHPGPDVTLDAAATAGGVARSTARSLLADLTGAHLLTEERPGRYAFHDLLRAYAHERCLAEDDAVAREAATTRLLDHYLHTGHRAALLEHPGRAPLRLPPPAAGVVVGDLTGRDDALAWLAADRRALVGAVELAAAAGHDLTSWRLGWTLTYLLARRGKWVEWAAVQETTAAAATRAGELRLAAQSHRDLARAYAWLGRFDAAHDHLDRALDLCGRLGDAPGAARVWMLTCWLLEQQGRYADALANARRALRVFAAEGDEQGHADALNLVGWHCTTTGLHRRALHYCGRALVRQRRRGSLFGEANTWDSLGHAHLRLGNLDKAARCYRRALDLFRLVDDRYHEAGALTRLGDIAAERGDRRAAREAWTAALAILDDVDHADADAVREKLAA